jgi:hypothetical protein
MSGPDASMHIVQQSNYQWSNLQGEHNVDWLNQIGGMLQQYTGGATTQAPPTVHDDFDRVTQAAPRSTIADALSAAFRSDRTPSFGQMAGDLFGRSNGQQRAGILNTILASLGPAALSQILGSGGGGSILGKILGNGKREVTPEEAEQIPPDAAARIAEHAEKEDPSIVDRVSDFYADHPTLVKTLGGTVLTVALAKIAQNHSGLF